MLIKIVDTYYNTYSEAAAKAGISLSVLRYRINRYGIDNPIILTKGRIPTYKRTKNQDTQITLCGKTYDSKAQAARAFNLDLSTLKRRIDKLGPNNPDIFKPSQKKSIPLMLNDIEYPSLIEASKALNISPSGLACRIKRYGHSDPRLTATRIHIGRQITLCNKYHFDTLKDAASFVGISSETMKDRIARYGLNDSRILKPKSNIHKGKPFTHRDMTYKSAYQAAKILHLPLSTLNNAINRFGHDTSTWPKTVIDRVFS